VCEHDPRLFLRASTLKREVSFFGYEYGWWALVHGAPKNVLPHEKKIFFARCGS
jgi:hypothetical protein